MVSRAWGMAIKKGQGKAKKQTAGGFLPFEVNGFCHLFIVLFVSQDPQPFIWALLCFALFLDPPMTPPNPPCQLSVFFVDRPKLFVFQFIISLDLPWSEMAEKGNIKETKISLWKIGLLTQKESSPSFEGLNSLLVFWKRFVFGPLENSMVNRTWCKCMGTFCSWKKSCTTWDVRNPVHTGLKYAKAHVLFGVGNTSWHLFFFWGIATHGNRYKWESKSHHKERTWLCLFEVFCFLESSPL